MSSLSALGVVAVAMLSVQIADAAQPNSLGGSAQSKVSAPQQQVKIQERKDNEIENKKNQKKSEREKREARGEGIGRSELETVSLEKNLSSALDNEIRYMEPLVAKLPRKSEQRPEIMRRLIENLHQKSLLVFFNESRKYDENWNRWDESGRRGLEPKFNMNESKLWTSRVIQRCQQFVTEYPEARGIDEVTFQLAYAFAQMGQVKEAAQYYSRLVQKFPNSRRVPDAHFALGEFHFNKQDFQKALTSFNEVVRFTRAPIRPWAEFKIAWSYYNLQQHDKAIERFKLVVNLSKSSSFDAGVKVRLKDESLRDMLLSYAEIKQIDAAMSYIAENASEKTMPNLFDKLSNLMQDKGEYDDSVRILKAFIAMRPNDFRSAEFQVQVADIANLKNDKTSLWKEIIELNKNFGPESGWIKANSKAPELKEMQEKIHNVSFSYAKKMHYLGQKENSAYYLEQAIKGYKIYLTTFPQRKEASEVRFLLGELQYTRDQFRDAEKTFSSFTANKDLKNADPKRFERAFEYQRTSAYFIVQKDVAAFRSQQFRIGQQPQPVSIDLQEYIKVCDAYVAAFPKKPGALDCQLDSAEIYLKTNNAPQAEKRLAILAKERAGKKEGDLAAEFLLLMSQNDKKKLAVTTNSLLDIPAIASGRLGKRLAEIKRSNRFDELKELEAAGKFEKAALEFERLSVEKAYSKSDAALFNAGVNYRRANRLEKSVQAYQRLIAEYPKSELIGDAMLEIIDLSAGRIQLQTAVNYVRMYLTRFPKSPKASKLLAGACAYYEALSQAERAREVCPSVIAAGGSDASAAAESMAGVMERSGRHAEFIASAERDLLRFATSASERIEIWHRIAEAAKRQGNRSKAASAEREIMKLYESNRKSVSGPALSYVGSIAFAKEFSLIDKFRKEPLAPGKSGAEFQQNIMKRNAELKTLTDRFSAVAQEIGDAEWSVASLYVVGYAHELVAAELLNPPQPPGISGEGWQKVKTTLAGLGVQLQKKAKEYYVNSAEIISKFNIYTEYGQKVLNSLARLEPAKYKKSEEWVPNAIFVGTEVIDSSKMKSALEPRG